MTTRCGAYCTIATGLAIFVVIAAATAFGTYYLARLISRRRP